MIKSRIKKVGIALIFCACVVAYVHLASFGRMTPRDKTRTALSITCREIEKYWIREGELPKAHANLFPKSWIDYRQITDGNGWRIEYTSLLDRSEIHGKSGMFSRDESVLYFQVRIEEGQLHYYCANPDVVEWLGRYDRRIHLGFIGQQKNELEEQKQGSLLQRK